MSERRRTIGLIAAERAHLRALHSLLWRRNRKRHARLSHAKALAYLMRGVWSLYLSKPAWGVIALTTAAGFFWLATRVDVYDATSPYGMSHSMFAHAPNVPHPWWLSLHILLRKCYSIAAFSIVGLTADKALAATARPRLRGVLLVAAYSAAIELMQHTVDPKEPFSERLLDVGCGAIGGYLGATFASLAVFPKTHNRRTG